MDVTIRQIHWTAGFLEGDGSFLFTKKGYPYVAAAQVQKWPLGKLQGLFGGPISRREAMGNSSAIHTWTLTGANAVGLMMTLYSLMSDGRKAQIKKALDVWKANPTKFRPKRSRFLKVAQ